MNNVSNNETLRLFNEFIKVGVLQETPSYPSLSQNRGCTYEITWLPRNEIALRFNAV